MRLLSASQQITLLPELEVANTLWSRTKGLLGRSSLSEAQGLWILPCNSVHTFFMKFTIDLVFLNKQMEVKKTLTGVKPGRMVWPVWGAHSVIELKAGFLEKHPLKVGEKLHVDRTVS